MNNQLFQTFPNGEVPLFATFLPLPYFAYITGAEGREKSEFHSEYLPDKELQLSSLRLCRQIII